MENFTFYSPTEFLFGKDTENMAGQMVKKHGGKKVLIHFGGGSVIKSGLIDRIKNSLETENLGYVLLGGAQSNPVDKLVYEGIELCRREGVDFILAVGGGSCIDSAKAIAMGVEYNGDFWDFFDNKASLKKAIKVATVLTIPAAGSEGSGDTVITKTEGMLKRGFGSPHLRPVFSILNPVLTFTLPPYQTACGIVDMLAHVFERYFTNTTGVEISDRLAEGIMQAIIKEAPQLFINPEDYEARANIMWSGTVAHNGTCGVGRVEDWASHMLEHELSALYNVAHGAGLAVIFPAWMKYVLDENVDRFYQFATRVWGICEQNDKRETAMKGINALECFFKSINMPTSFSELGASEKDIEKLVEKLNENTGGSFGNFKKLNMNDAKNIYKLACK